MKNIVLIRHAKSSWDLPLPDTQRPLSNRGIKDAHLVAEQVHKILPKSTIVWSSTAKRAQNTAQIFAEHLHIPLESIIFKDTLYTFDERNLTQTIVKCNNAYDNLIIFGHNNAITDFVNKFGSLKIDNVPTSGVVFLQFSIKNWQELNKGITLHALFPKDIKNELATI